MRTSARRIGVGVLAAVALVGLTSGTAQADTRTSTSTATSVTAFTVGGTTYYQGHTNDDFGLDVTSGIAIDARWASCKISGSTGQIHYGITPSNAMRVLGTNFLATTCLKVHYRGYTSTGTFTSRQYWNYSFA
jgi:hypothetical protein